MKKPKNPFVIQGYVGAKYFCDRENELKLLKAHVLNDRNFTLYGWRRLGKTSLLSYLAEEVEKSNILTLFIDLSTCRDFKELEIKTVEEVYNTIGKTAEKSLLQKLHQVIGALGISMSFNPMTGMPSFSINSSRKNDEPPSLKVLFQFLSNFNRNILIIFDEFQQINYFPQSNTEATIRKLSQQYPNLRFGFCGSHRGLMQSMFSSANRPFYKSTQIVDLGPIVLDSYLKFIQSHFKTGNKTISDALVKKIYEWCRGETYSIQLICNRLYAKKKKVTAESFIETSGEIIEEQSRLFGEWLNLLPYNQVKLLKAMADCETVKSPTSQAFILQYDLGAASSVQTAINGLIDKQIIFKDQGSYYIHDVLFGKWLKQ